MKGFQGDAQFNLRSGEQVHLVSVLMVQCVSHLVHPLVRMRMRVHIIKHGVTEEYANQRHVRSKGKTTHCMNM